MQKLFYSNGRTQLLVGVVLLLAVATSCSSQNKQQSEVTAQQPGFTLVYTSNVSGEIEPCGCRGSPAGGIARKWDFFRQAVFPHREQTLIVDSGDLLFASTTTPPFLAKQWNSQAAAVIDGYNATGCDAFTPGDQDFSSGFEEFERLRKRARFPFLAANLTHQGKPYLTPYIILKRSGTNIGIFGLYNEELPLPPELSATNHIEAAKQMVSQLRGKVDTIIALTHLGLDLDVELAKAVPGIDIIAGAHSQSFLQEPVKVGTTTILQTSYRNQHIGVYENGKNKLVELDSTFNSNGNPMSALAERNKIMIAELNKRSEAELSDSDTGAGSGPGSGSWKTVSKDHYQTFVSCAGCHTAQHDFWKNTAHGKAYKTLVGKKQHLNKDCLGCHTLGAGEPTGWKSVNSLVLSKSGSKVGAEDFSASYASMSPSHLARYKAAYINVQCEHCHGAGADHPFGASGLKKSVNTDTCLKCHTIDQAPSWYKSDRSPDQNVLEGKKKAVSCPAQ